MTFEDIIDHYPQLTREDILAALAYAAELAHEGLWKTADEQSRIVVSS